MAEAAKDMLTKTPQRAKDLLTNSAGKSLPGGDKLPGGQKEPAKVGKAS